MSKFCFVALMLAAVLLASEVRAADSDTVAMTPGMWSFESTVVMSMMPEPQVSRNTSCLEGPKIDPLKELTNDSGCKVSERSLSGNTLKWKMSCPNQMGAMTGSGELTSTGETVEGSMVARMSMQGQPIELNTSWKGKRTGPCKN